MNTPLYSSECSPGYFVQKYNNEKTLSSSEMGPKLVVFMVGLPARGKSYLVKKLLRYLNWLGVPAKSFNVGAYRRKLSSFGRNNHGSEFFDNANDQSKKQREKIASDTLEDLINWLKEEGKIGILDATNTTASRRCMLLDRLKKEDNFTAMFVESICDDPEVLKQNIQMKLLGPDYHDKDKEFALEDFNKRIENYKKNYETISETEEENNIQYCKIINVGKKIISFNIRGYLPSQVVYYLMNFNLKPRKIWLTRHGESYDNRAGKIGGNASLTDEGKKYAVRLKKFMEMKTNEEREENLKNGIKNEKLQIWTSMLKRTIETAQHFSATENEILHIKPLNEIHAGNCEGLTYQEVKEKYPREFESRQMDKVNYRYFGALGESYLDVVHRLNQVIIELERVTSSVLVISHRAVIRVLLAYMLDIELAEAIKFPLKLQTIICIEPKPYGSHITKYSYDKDVDDIVLIK